MLSLTLVGQSVDLAYDDANYDSGGLFTGKSHCSSLRQVKEEIQEIREDDLSLRLHGTVTFDFGETEPRNVHFQCTVRGSSHALRMVSSTYGWRKCEAGERYRKWKEDHERRRRRREEQARERTEKDRE